MFTFPPITTHSMTRMLRAFVSKKNISNRLIFSASRLMSDTVKISDPQLNPLKQFAESNELPPFKRLEIAHLEPVLTETLQSVRKTLNEVEQKIQSALDNGKDLKWNDIVDPVEKEKDLLDRVWGIVGHLMSVKNSQSLRNVHDQLLKPVTETYTMISQSRAVYDAFESISKGTLWKDMVNAQRVKLRSYSIVRKLIL